MSTSAIHPAYVWNPSSARDPLEPSYPPTPTAAARPSHYGLPAVQTNYSPPAMRPLSPRPAARPANDRDYNQSPTSPATQKKRKRTPDWNEFYKNGLPEVVIVIDDDTPPPQNGARPQQPQQQQQQQPPNDRPAQEPASRHAAKKQRISDQFSQAKYRREDWDSISPSDRLGTGNSSERTNSAHNTTAATSLGSYRSQNDQYVPAAVSAKRAADEDDDQVGQKRKRTRKTIADQKLQEVSSASDAMTTYHPPPKPPIKAKEVYVAVTHDPTMTKDTIVDDKDGHYIVVPSTALGDRYEIRKLLGQGTFGKVVEAYDRVKRTKCAIKIIRSVQKYRDASRIELRVLATLGANDRDNRNKCIHLRDCFDFRNHICIVTDLLGSSVFDFLKANAFVPFPNSHIQNFARQLFTSVAFLHDLNLIHTDLKPENILLVRSEYQTFTYGRQIPSSSTINVRSSRSRRVLFDTEIRLIDFGSATFDDEYHSSVVSTRHYRAPEIIFGLGWSFPCDIWSIGCILVEFFTGDALFQTHDNLEHLAMMEAVCNNKIDTKIIKQIQSNGRRHADSPAKYFKGTKLDYPNSSTTKASRKYVKAMKALEDIIPANSAFNKQFLNLLRRIFVYDPKQRITAKEALQHPWFKENFLDDGTEAARLDRQRRSTDRNR